MSLEGSKVITFKVYVFKNQKPTEIRKFSLKTNDLSFEKMEENLLAIFPNLKDSKYTLLWKDQEEDFITLSTSKEFSTFEAHVTKTEANKEIKLFINFEDELFAASQTFEQYRLNLNFSCNACQKKLTLTCLDCTSKKSLQEPKILNIANQTSGQIRQNENGEVKTSTTSSGSNITRQTFSDMSAFNTPPNSAPVTFPAAPAVSTASYQFGLDKKTTVFGNNFK